MFLRFSLIIKLLFLTGCFSNHLEHSEPLEDLKALVSSARSHIPLLVTDHTEKSSHGYQFMFGIIPVTRIFTDSLSTIVTAKLQYNAGRGGIGLVNRLSVPQSTSRLEVAIQSASINGFDLIFFRRPSARITLLGTLFSDMTIKRSCEVSADQSEISRFAFNPELTEVLSSTTDTASLKLLKCLGLIDEG